MAKEKSPPKIDPEIHKRVLRFLNAARTPQDLLELPQNEIELLVDPEHRRKRPDPHEPIEKKLPVKLFDIKQAEHVLKGREELSPIHGFSHIDQLKNIHGVDWGEIWGNIFEQLMKWFSNYTYGEWSDPIDLVDEDGTYQAVASQSLTVDNVAPTLTLDAVAMIDENGVATLTGTIDDPGTLDTFTLDVNWGDPLSPDNIQQFAFAANRCFS